MKSSEYFRNEDHFQGWVVEELNVRGHHAQPITGDDKYPGIPDLTIGLHHGVDVWAEVKLWRKVHDVYDIVSKVMAIERPVTAQQRKWLITRGNKGGSVCGVLVAWRTKHSTNYVSFVPISRWDEVLEWNLAALALSDFTVTLPPLISGEIDITRLLMGGPGASRTTSQQ